MRNKLVLRSVIALILLTSICSNAIARTFYVSSSYTGATSNGSFSTPWKSLSVLQSNLASVMPGDTVAFKSGDFFLGTLSINRSGTSAAPIVFTSYGTGNMPVFTGTGSTITNLFAATGRSYLIFDGLEVRDTTISATDRTIPAKIRNCFQLDGASTYNTIKNCKISLVGVGAYFAPGANYNTIDNCDIGNMRMVVNTPTTVNNNDDYGANPVVISSTNNKVLNSYFHDCWANSYDYGYDGGAVEFYGSTGVSNNFIAYNTFYDCCGTVEFGSGNGGNMTNNVFAYNKFINNGKLFYINNSGAYTVNVTNLQFLNNTIVESQVVRNASTSMGSMSVTVATPGIVVFKNNAFYLSSGIDVVRASQWTGGQLIHEDNVYRLSNNSIANYTLSASEVSSSSNFWTNMSNTNPLNWDYHPAASSLLIDMGQSVGQSVDFDGNPMNGNPDIGIYEVQASVPVTPTPLVGNASFTPISCYGGNSTITITASGGTAPYYGTGVFTVSAGSYSYVITDAGSQTDTVSVNITQPSIIAVGVSSGTITTPGGTTNVQVTASGGTGNSYTYSLDGGVYQSSNTFSNVASGNHTVNVKDANGCIMAKTFFISAPVIAPLSATATAGAILCNGGSTTVNVTATGGVSPYTGTGSFNVNAGTYNYIVSDAGGNRDTVAITVAQPAALNQTLSSGTITVYGGNTSITSTSTGGTGTKTYKLDNGTYQSSNIFNGVLAGNHAVTVKDANGCTVSTNISIAQPALPTLSAVATFTPISCNGGNSIVTVSATGGLAPYTGTGNYTVVSGTYTYTITDSRGVSASTSVVITQPALLNLNLTSGTITAFGGTTSLTAATSGGTSPYTFSLNNGSYQSSNIFNGLSAGNYSVTVKDANNCTKTSSITISQPGALNVSATSGTILCNGGTTSVTVAASGGVSPYSGTGNFTVGAGTYNYTVTDANGNTQTTSITVNQPSLLSVTVVSGTIAIMGGNTTLTVNANGGTPAYTYKLDNGTYQTSNIFNGVLAGNHTITVKDNNACTKIVTVSVVQPTALLSCTATAGSILCNGGTANVTVSATGGTAPYTGTGVFNASAGTRTYTVSDANGVTASTTITLAEPTSISVSAVAGTISTYGGFTSVSVTATGGSTGYSYAIDNNAYQTSNIINNVGAGNHIVYVKDANGCIGNMALSITQPTQNTNIIVTATPGVITCFGGTTMVAVSASGGVAPYSGTGNFSAGAGTRTYTVRDATGATQSTTITISQPTDIQATITVAGEVTTTGGTTSGSIAASGGTPGYTYSLDGGISQTSSTFRTLTAGSHYVTVVDANGCAKVFTFTVYQAQSSSMVLTLVSKSDVTCKGGTDGKIEVIAAGGRAPYTYAIGTGIYGINNKFYNLRAGIYRVYAKDANNNLVNLVVSIADGKRRCSTGRLSDEQENPAIEISAPVKITAYPNPSSQSFSVKLDNFNGDVQLDVMDMNGRIVYKDKGASTKTFKFGNEFRPGIYFVRIIQGDLIRTEKVIKM